MPGGLPLSVGIQRVRRRATSPRARDLGLANELGDLSARDQPTEDIADPQGAPGDACRHHWGGNTLPNAPSRHSVSEHSIRQLPDLVKRNAIYRRVESELRTQGAYGVIRRKISWRDLVVCRTA